MSQRVSFYAEGVRNCDTGLTLQAPAAILRRSAKKMGYIIYRCSDDFPAKISEILSALPSPATTAGGPRPESELESAYRYDVKRGMGRISIYGCRDDGFMSVAIVNGSRNPLRARASLKLSIDATKALIDAGMEEVTVEDLEELESQRKQK